MTLQMAELQPRIDELEATVEETRQELGKHKAALQKLQGERNAAAERGTALRAAKSDAEAQKTQLAAQLTKIRGEPEKMKKQADIAKGAADSHQGQAEKTEDEIKSVRAMRRGALRACAALGAERVQRVVKLVTSRGI